MESWSNITRTNIIYWTKSKSNFRFFPLSISFGQCSTARVLRCDKRKWKRRKIYNKNVSCFVALWIMFSKLHRTHTHTHIQFMLYEYRILLNSFAAILMSFWRVYFSTLGHFYILNRSNNNLKSDRLSMFERWNVHAARIQPYIDIRSDMNHISS